MVSLSANYVYVVGGYVIVDEKLPRYVVPDLTDFKVFAFSPFN